VTFQLSQIHAQETNLLQDSSVQNRSNNSFQNYLDEEQKRLTLMLSSFGQIGLASIFGYPKDNYLSNNDFSFEIEIPKNESSTDSQFITQQDKGNKQPQQNQTTNYLTANNYQPKSAQFILQDILAKTGWLSPNLEASPLFFNAQLDGKLLNKLDLQSLIDQIITQIKLVKGKGKTQLTLGLKPESLGEILLSLTSKSGMITINISAPKETKKLLESSLEELELALKKSKIKITELTIQEFKEVKKHA
jgi:Flagellar hook-length control protein FliK